MEKQKEKDMSVQGTETITGKKQQKKSTSYALKAVRTHFETLENDKLISKEEKEQLEVIVKKAAETFIKREYGIG